MKKISISVTLIVTVAMIFQGCQKNPQLEDQKESIQDLAYAQKITSMIIDFKGRLLLKQNDSLSIDSSVWYLESLLNYEIGQNNHTFDSLQFIKV